MISAQAVARPERIRIGLVGDDLSGVAAVAGAFAGYGFTCRIEFAGPDAPTTHDCEPVDLLALMTESRHLPAEMAAEKVRAAVERLTAAGCDLIFKKVDSLLRGPVGAELAAVARALPGKCMMVATAAPGNGRITRGGAQLNVDALSCDGADEGSFIRTKPAVEHIPSLLVPYIDREVVPVPLELLARPDLLAATFASAAAPVIVCDAERLDHLRLLALTAFDAGVRVYAGASDLAAALAAAITRSLGKDTCATTLVVAGSASATVRGQLADLEQKGLAEIVWMPATDPNAMQLEAMARSAVEKARRFPAVVLASRTPTGRVTPIAAARMENILAVVSADIAGRLPLAGIVATGGDTATAILRVLGVVAVEPTMLLESGIAFSTVCGGRHDGLYLITKPGAFGDPGCLAHLVGILRVLETTGRLAKGAA